MILKKTKSGIPAKELSLALAEATKCGCGIECDCYGYITLPNWDSVSGERTDGYALYLVDGELQIDTITNAKTALDIIKGIDPATSVVITGCPLVPVIEGGTVQLTASVLPANALQTGVWSTSNSAVATVSVAGLVTAIGAGEVIITFTSTSGITSTCTITVAIA